MSKAEEKGIRAYPISIVEREGIDDIPSFDRHSLERNAFIKGYYQAEKDLALNWMDMFYVIDTFNELSYSELWRKQPMCEVCKEILRRFNERKGKQV